MVKENMHIEIVSSNIKGLSSMSEPSRLAIYKTLKKYYKKVGITIVNNLSDLEALVSKNPDLVFLGMKYIPDPKPRGIWLSNYLSERGIAVTGSPSIAHRLELNKPLAKKCVRYAGLKTSEYCVIRADQSPSPEMIPSRYPLFVKPTNLGGGAGIDSDSVVHNFSELSRKVESISEKYGGDSLVERYLSGREFSVAILKNEDSRDYLTMPIELVAPLSENGVKLLSSSVKAKDAEQVKEVIDDRIRDSINKLAIGAFESIGGRDYGRIDIRMSDMGVPHFLEANLIPSLIDNYGSFPKACALNMNIDYEDMLLRIVSLAMNRLQFTSETTRATSSLKHYAYPV